MPITFPSTVVAALAIGGAVLFAQPAAAAPGQTTLGPSITSIKDSQTCGWIDGCAVVHDRLPAQFNDRAPYDGVVVRWRVQGEGFFQLFPGQYTTGNTFRRGKATTIQYGPTLSRVSEFAARTRIKQGDAIGLLAHQGAAVGTNPDFNDNIVDTWAHGLPYDTPTPSNTPNLGVRTGFQAVIEPDADQDGYGDVTQDKCPSKVSTIDVCDAPDVPPAPEEPETPLPPGPAPPAPAPSTTAPAPTPSTTAPPVVSAPQPAGLSAPTVRARSARGRHRAFSIPFTLSEPATLRVIVSKGKGKGRRVITTRSFSGLQAGNGVIRILHRGLRRPGRYRATLVPVAAGRSGRAVIVSIRMR